MTKPDARVQSNNPTLKTAMKLIKLASFFIYIQYNLFLHVVFACRVIFV